MTRRFMFFVFWIRFTCQLPTKNMLKKTNMESYARFMSYQHHVGSTCSIVLFQDFIKHQSDVRNVTIENVFIENHSVAPGPLTSAPTWKLGHVADYNIIYVSSLQLFFNTQIIMN